jgi:16S rRNA processing protein RimM
MRLQVARIGKPHGIRGEVTVQVMTDSPGERFTPGEVFDVEPATIGQLTVEGARWNKDILLLAFEEVLDRNRAETLRGAKLFVETDDDADDDDDDDAWYEHELAGLDVRVDGQSVGKVTGLRTQTAQDLLIVASSDGHEVLVPFVEAIVPVVDVAGGFIAVTPPPGLFGLNADDDAAGGGS